MEIVGKIYKVMPVFEGQSTRGPWKKREFVIETEDNFPKKVHFTLFGDNLVPLLDNIALGDQVKVYFNPESREWNERWYTDLRCYRIDKISAQPLSANAAPLSETATPVAPTTPYTAPASPVNTENIPEDGDDLPF